MSPSSDELPIFRAARHWAANCLMKDGSVFTDESIWTEAHLVELERHFILNPEEGKGSFLVKLEGQLAAASPEASKLAAEMLWVMYLQVSTEAMTAATKLLQITQVYGWSGDPLPEDHWALRMDLLGGGVSHPGTAYNTHRWREFRFFIDAMLEWKRLTPERREELFRNPWAFADWLDARDYARGRQLRHMLLFLLFPDHFERAATTSHKEQIVEAFGDPGPAEDEQETYGDRVELDRAVRRVREHLADEMGRGPEDVDFYGSALREKWLPEATKAPVSAGGGASDTEPGDAQRATEWIRSRFGDATVWLMSAGEGGRLWREFQELEAVAVSWDYLGDFRDFETRDEIHAAIAEEEKRENPYNSSLAVWQFSREMKEGDVVIVKRGLDRVLGWGIVTGPYRHDTEREEYRNLRSVSWKAKGTWELGRSRGAATKALTDMTPYPEWIRRVFSVIEGGVEGLAPSDDPTVTYTLKDALEGLFLEPTELSEILDALGRRKNVILQGPPGVGKTFVARRLAYALIRRKDPDRVSFVQFHQSYAYEDFMQGWRPNAQGGFTLNDGVFMRACRDAEADPDTPHVFIIDEINRANLSRVLGELMMLIERDKRGSKHAIPLTYSPEHLFSVPENLHVIGLMNTADRSLALVDYALRRRFTFLDLKPAFGSDRFMSYLLDAGVSQGLVEQIDQRMRALNDAIRSDARNLGPGFEVGHSYFVPGDEEEARDEAWYRRIIREEIAPLLREYWFDNPERAEEHIRTLLG